MIPSRNSVVDAASSPPAAFSPAARAASVSCRPAPGCSRLPTTSPMIRANVDISDEVGQGQAADLADLGRLPDGADAEHDRAEDHRADHHLDQVHERGAQRLERLTDVGGDQTDDDAEHHRGDHRDIEVMRAIFLLGGGCSVVADSDMKPPKEPDNLGDGPHATQRQPAGSMRRAVDEVTYVFIVFTFGGPGCAWQDAARHTSAGAFAQRAAGSIRAPGRLRRRPRCR